MADGIDTTELEEAKPLKALPKTFYDSKPMNSTSASLKELAMNKAIIDAKIGEDLKILAQSQLIAEKNRQESAMEDAQFKKLDEWQKVHGEQPQKTADHVGQNKPS